MEISNSAISAIIFVTAAGIIYVLIMVLFVWTLVKKARERCKGG
jgi:hypothetical protein